METGYIIKVVGPVPPEIKKDADRRKPRGPEVPWKN